MSHSDPSLPARCCRSCHFFMAQPRNSAVIHCVTTEERDNLDAGRDTDWFSASCERDVWRCKAPCTSELAFRTDIRRDRGEECFFYPHTPGMRGQAAQELERRAAGRREAEKDRRLTRDALRQSKRAAKAAKWTAIAAIIAALGSWVVPLSIESCRARQSAAQVKEGTAYPASPQPISSSSDNVTSPANAKPARHSPSP